LREQRDLDRVPDPRAASHQSGPGATGADTERAVEAVRLLVEVAGRAQHRAVLEPVADERVDGPQRHNRIEGIPGIREELGEHLGHREQRSARVEPERTGRRALFEAPDLPADRLRRLEHGDVVAQRGESGGGGETTDARADHNRTRHVQILPQPG
jgi:hypothetical protein